MNRLIILFLAILIIGDFDDAEAKWKVIRDTDAITDEKRAIASVTNSSGYRFGLYKHTSGSVYGLFSLPDPSGESISPKNPIYLRVDKYPAQEVGGPAERSVEHLIGERLYDWNPGFVRFRLWHGKPEEGVAPFLRQLMAGQQLIVRFPLFTGGAKDIRFPLDGAQGAINSVLDLREVNRSGEDETPTRRYTNVVRDYHRKCQAGASAELSGCLQKYLLCGKRYPSPAWENLSQCLSE